MDIRASVVGIISSSSKHKYAGTGFFAAPGIILTCDHILNDAQILQDRVFCTREDSQAWIQAEIIFRSDPATLDLAILKLINPQESGPTLPLIASRTASGFGFTTFGYPLEGAGQGLRAEGQIHGWVRDPFERDALQIASDEITHGFSGCPIFCRQVGGIAGMLRSGFDFGLDKKLGRLGFAIPSEVLQQAWPDLELTPADSLASAAGAEKLAALFQLPAPPANFTGRAAELAHLIQLDSAVICGVGGSGKTAFGLMAAHKIAQNHPDAQFFTNLRGVSREALDPAEALRRVIQSLQPSADLRGMSEEQLGALYRSLLAGKKVLLFFDNARDAAQIQPLLPPPGCAMIVTTRSQFKLEGIETLRLELLSEVESVELLLSIAPTCAPVAAQIAALCGGLPLALKLAGTFLFEHPDWLPVEYLDELRLRRLAMLTNQDDPAQSVEAVFEMSYKQLDASAQADWRALAVFNGSFTREALAAVCELEAGLARERASALLRVSLLEFDPASARYHLLDLLRDFASSRLSPEENHQAHLRHGQYYLNLLAKADETFCKGGDHILAGLNLFDREWLQIESAQKWAAEHIEQGAADLAMRLPGAGAYCLDLRLPPLLLAAWLDSGLRAARMLKNRSMENRHIANLGNAWFKHGDARRAVEYYAQHLEIARELGDRIGEGNALGNLGNAYYDLGETYQAITYYQRRLALARETGDLAGKAHTLGNLGSAYLMLGNIREAIGLFEERLALARESGDRIGESNTLGNLGLAYYHLGNVRQAIVLQEEKLVLTQTLGDRRGQATTLSNLGLAFAAQGQITEAIKLYQQALAIDQEIGDRRGESQDLSNLGLAHADLGDVRHALTFYEQALKIDRETANLRGQADNLKNIGQAYSIMGDHQAAIQLYQQALLIDRKTGNRRGEAQNLGSLGNSFANLGDHAQAISLYEQQLLINREIGDRRGESTALGNLGIVFYNQGQLDQAANYYQQNLLIAREIENRRGEANALNNLALIYSNPVEAQLAIEYFLQALEIYHNVHDRAGEANTLGNLGSACYMLGQAEKAREYYQRKLAITRELGDRRGEGLALSGLGLAHGKLGEPDREFEFHEEHLKIAREIGDRHGEASALGNLGSLLAEQKNYHEALKFHQLALQLDLEIGDWRGARNALRGLGSSHLALSNPQQALRFHEQALEIDLERDDRREQGYDLFNLAQTCLELGDAASASDLAQQALAIHLEYQDPGRQEIQLWLDRHRQ